VEHLKFDDAEEVVEKIAATKTINFENKIGWKQRVRILRTFAMHVSVSDKEGQGEAEKVCVCV
jgi:hypothetical protein